MKSSIATSLVVTTLFVLIACELGVTDPGKNKLPAAAADAPTVAVHVIDKTGKLVGPVKTAKVVKDEASWRAQLSKAEFEVTRNAGTESAFSGSLLKNKSDGVYTCVGCGLPLFSSKTKFTSDTGWPSFYEAIAKPNVGEKRDTKFGWERVEILCNRCDAHLGHLFKDGPKPTGLRYCVNSVAMQFTATEKLKDIGEALPAKAATRASAVLAGGCFWCVEAVFEDLTGVVEVISGYAGGSAKTANYADVCSGTSGHAEVVKIIYDPTKVSYGELLQVHFSIHDPTTLNRQGPDAGTQYRSAIFYANETERATAAAYIATLTNKKVFPNKIVTTLEPLKKFYPAEEKHQNYVRDNPGDGYVRAIALPKLKKFRKKYPDQLKKQ